MTSPDKAPTPAQAARRQLVRGAFAAPALLTVYSGSALANASAKRCLVNQTNTPRMEPVATAADNFVRIQLHQTGTSTNPTYWVSGATINNLKRNSTTVFIESTKWQQFDVTNNRLVGSAIDMASTPALSSNPQRWAAVRFNAAGSVRGVGVASATGESALANTCWNSVGPTL
ncbi:hypothetical protein D621_09375 [beta proteobacterium AAP51]|nr:hypothetical protein D621_09375 [beta proteobacterium AAP51]